MLDSSLFRTLGLPQFQTVELTAQIQRVIYVPGFLGSFGEALFPISRISSLYAAFSRNDDRLSLIPTSERGSPPVELELKRGDVLPFLIHRLAKGSTVMADSMTGFSTLAYDGIEAVRTVQEEFAERAAKIRRDMEFTHEFQRFGAVQGIVYDADGSVLDNFWESWGTAMPAWIELPLNNTAMSLSTLRETIRGILRNAKRTSKGGWIQNRTKYHALCGETFFNKLVTHPAVEKLYLNYRGAVELGQEIEDNFNFGGIFWHDYEGDEDGVLAIADDEAHLFPLGGNECFRQVFGPAEFEPWIGKKGQDLYALTIPDRDRGASFRWEGYSYPLCACTRPGMLRRIRIAANASGPIDDGGEND